MDRVLLEERKSQLKLQLDQAVSNANALQGAIQQVDWCISKIIDEEEAAKGQAVAAQSNA